MSFILLLAMTMLAVVPAEKAVSFKIVENDAVPQSLIDKINNCDYDTAQTDACRKEFLERNNVWSGDVNGDGVDEFLVHPSAGWHGSGGYSVSLYKKEKDTWRSLLYDDFDSGILVQVLRFQIVPIERGGYRDLRIGASICYRWYGEHYDMCGDEEQVEEHAEEYGEKRGEDGEEYDGWKPGYFDQTDWLNAELFWEMRYRGRKEFKVDPIWLDTPASWPSDVSRILEDAEYHIHWIVVPRRGVWGMKGKRGFLLMPVWMGRLEIKGDWLIIEHGGPGDSLVSRYNRRTGRLERESAPGKPLQ